MNEENRSGMLIPEDYNQIEKIIKVFRNADGTTKDEMISEKQEVIDMCKHSLPGMAVSVEEFFADFFDLGNKRVWLNVLIYVSENDE